MASEPSDNESGSFLWMLWHLLCLKLMNINKYLSPGSLTALALCLTHKLFIFRCHTSIFAAHRLRSSLMVLRVTQLWVCFSYVESSRRAAEIVLPVLCIFHIFFVFTLKTVIYHLPENKRDEFGSGRLGGWAPSVVSVFASAWRLTTTKKYCIQV